MNNSELKEALKTIEKPTKIIDELTTDNYISLTKQISSDYVNNEFDRLKKIIAKQNELIDTQDKLNAKLEYENDQLRSALKVFANYACDDWYDCDCHNCTAKKLLNK